MLVGTFKEQPILRFANPSAFREWLVENAESADSVWLQFSKKGSGHTTVTYIEARDEALCFGWIDSVKYGFDEQFYLMRFSQRRPRSVWSKINCGVIEELVASGRMSERGLREVEQAKKDGRWDRAYEPQSTATVPDDLAAAIAANPKAAEFFATLKGSKRYVFIFRTNSAKTEATRAKRIAEFVRMLAEGQVPSLL